MKSTLIAASLLLLGVSAFAQTSSPQIKDPASAASRMKEAGFCESRAEHLLGPDLMVIGIK